MKDSQWLSILSQLENLLIEADGHELPGWVVQDMAETVMRHHISTAWNKTYSEAKAIAHDLVCLNPDLREKTIII